MLLRKATMSNLSSARMLMMSSTKLGLISMLMDSNDSARDANKCFPFVLRDQEVARRTWSFQIGAGWDASAPDTA